MFSIKDTDPLPNVVSLTSISVHIVRSITEKANGSSSFFTLPSSKNKQEYHQEIINCKSKGQERIVEAGIKGISLLFTLAETSTSNIHKVKQLLREIAKECCIQGLPAK
jgi:hypothetical protein